MSVIAQNVSRCRVKNGPLPSISSLSVQRPRGRRSPPGSGIGQVNYAKVVKRRALMICLQSRECKKKHLVIIYYEVLHQFSN